MTGTIRGLVVLAVAWAVFPSGLHAQENPYHKALGDAGWIRPCETVLQTDRDWFETVVFGDDVIWETDDDCTSFKGAMGTFLSNTPMY